MGPVATFKLKFVDVQRDRSGQVAFFYFRRHGRRWRLPGAPPSEEFMSAYRALVKATAPTKAAVQAVNPPGSFGALVKDFLGSGTFKEKKPSTQSEYRRVLEALR